MSWQHKNLAAGRWYNLSLIEQMGNIGSEISRAVRWQNKDEKLYQNSIERALELLDLTIKDSRWRMRLKEPMRVRELLCSAMLDNKEYKTSLKDLERYFFYFALAARVNK